MSDSDLEVVGNLIGDNVFEDNNILFVSSVICRAASLLC